MNRRLIACLLPSLLLAVLVSNAQADTKKSHKNCNIKGNISYRTGEKIYHVPGQRYYNATKINTGKGERWFCSERAARKAGWRKSKR